MELDKYTSSTHLCFLSLESHRLIQDLIPSTVNLQKTRNELTVVRLGVLLYGRFIQKNVCQRPLQGHNLCWNRTRTYKFTIPLSQRLWIPYYRWDRTHP